MNKARIEAANARMMENDDIKFALVVMHEDDPFHILPFPKEDAIDYITKGAMNELETLVKEESKEIATNEKLKEIYLKLAENPDDENLINEAIKLRGELNA